MFAQWSYVVVHLYVGLQVDPIQQQHPVAGIDFAILLVVLAASAVTVEYELGSEGEHYACRGAVVGEQRSCLAGRAGGASAGRS